MKLCVVLVFPIVAYAIASSSSNIFLIFLLVRNMWLGFFLSILSPTIVKKYFASFLLENINGHNKLRICWIVSVSGIESNKFRSLICFTILILVLYFHCSKTRSFDIFDNSLWIMSSSFTIVYCLPLYS